MSLEYSLGLVSLFECFVTCILSSSVWRHVMWCVISHPLYRDQSLQSSHNRQCPAADCQASDLWHTHRDTSDTHVCSRFCHIYFCTMVMCVFHVQFVCVLTCTQSYYHEETEAPKLHTQHKTCNTKFSLISIMPCTLWQLDGRLIKTERSSVQYT